MPEANTIFALVLACLVLLFAFTVFVFITTLFRPWLQGFLSGASVSVIDLIGMRLRKIDVQAVIRSLILARQSSVPLSHVDLQRAYLRGVDLEKITLAHIQAQKQDLGATFEELVELELKGRLAEKLKLKR